MASTYSTSLRIQLIGTGDQAGTWGTTTNTNLGTLIEQAITGVQSIALSGATYTLSNLNGVLDESRNAVLNFTGALSANCTVTAPAVEKVYIIANNTTGGYNVIMSSGGTTVSVTPGNTSLVYCDGTNFKSAITYDQSNVAITGGTINGAVIGGITPAAGSFTTLAASGTFGVTGTLTASGDLIVNGNTTLGNATSDTITFNANTVTLPSSFTFSSTGAAVLPKGTTGQQPTGIAGMIRYNTGSNSFEGYNGTSWGAIGGGNTTSNGLWQNIQLISTNQTISSGYSATSAGPITVGAGVTITVPSDSRWVIL
jgi:hypothetical protein